MSGTPRPNLPLADSTPLTSEGGSGNGAKANPSMKTKDQVQHLLASLEKEGVEIDGKITSIVDAEIAKIKAETLREAQICSHHLDKEASNASKRGGTMGSAVVTCFGLVLLTFVSGFAGFNMGADWFENAFREEYARRTYKLDDK